MFKTVVVSIAAVASSVDAVAIQAPPCCPDGLPDWVTDNLCNFIGRDNIDGLVPNKPEVIGGGRIMPLHSEVTCGMWKNEIYDMAMAGKLAEDICRSAPTREIGLKCIDHFAAEVAGMNEGVCNFIEPVLKKTGVLPDDIDFQICPWVYKDQQLD